jgi:hypothetical protein
MRLAQTQVWPAFRYFEAMAPLTAISMSASSKTMNGALPPNSRDSFLIVPAHCCISNLPTSVEPVKVSLRTVGFEVSSPPILFDHLIGEHQEQRRDCEAQGLGRLGVDDELELRG